MTEANKSPVPVAIPVRIYDAALRFCNERRAEAGLDDWDALPAGRACSPHDSPCALAVPGLPIRTAGAP